MTGATRDLFLRFVYSNMRLMDRGEAFDFYVEHVMRNSVSCKWNEWHNEGKGRHEDYALWELEAKASQWHKNTVGSLVLQGVLPLNIADNYNK